MKGDWAFTYDTFRHNDDEVSDPHEGTVSRNKSVTIQFYKATDESTSLELVDTKTFTLGHDGSIEGEFDLTTGSEIEVVLHDQVSVTSNYRIHSYMNLSIENVHAHHADMLHFSHYETTLGADVTKVAIEYEVTDPICYVRFCR